MRSSSLSEMVLLYTYKLYVAIKLGNTFFGYILSANQPFSFKYTAYNLKEKSSLQHIEHKPLYTEDP